jgi:hypothetical protein
MRSRITRWSSNIDSLDESDDPKTIKFSFISTFIAITTATQQAAYKNSNKIHNQAKETRIIAESHFHINSKDETLVNILSHFCIVK